MRSTVALVFVAAALVLPLAGKDPMTTLRVEVTNHKEQPVARASVTLRFEEGRSLNKLGKKLRRHWETRTNQQGVASFPPIPQGKVLLLVIADNYQTYGARVELDEEEKTIQVKLNPPQPQYSAH